METNIRQDNNEEVEIDIMQIIRMLLSKIWIVIVAGVVTAIVAFGITEIAITPQYQSSIKLYIINRQNGTTTTLSDIQSSTQLVKDYKVLVTSLPVVEQVVKDLDLDITPDALVGKISCEIETDSRPLSLLKFLTALWAILKIFCCLIPTVIAMFIVIPIGHF